MSTFEAESAGRLDAVLAQSLPDVSRARCTALVKEGQVTVDGQVVKKPSLKVRAGQVLGVTVPEPEPVDAQPEDLPVSIVYQDADLVVIDKGAGMVVHPAPGHTGGTLVNALLHHIDDLSGIGGQLRPGIVHRLDKGTSGLMVVAKNDRAHQHLAAQFADHSAGRTYWALCLGEPRDLQGTVRSELGRHPRDRTRIVSVERGGRPAVTHWWARGRVNGQSWIECRLETGRTHQVRVHLCESGWPLLGDPLYRTRQQPRLEVRELLPSDRPLLHAVALALTHPTSGERLELTAAPPEDWATVHQALGLPDWRPRYSQLSSSAGT